MTIRANRDHIRVLLYSYYTTITGWGDPPNIYFLSMVQKCTHGPAILGSLRRLIEERAFMNKLHVVVAHIQEYIYICIYKYIWDIWSVSPNRGAPYRPPPKTRILMIGSPIMVPLSLGNLPYRDITPILENQKEQKPEKRWKLGIYD